MAASSHVTLRVFDTLGRTVVTLVNGVRPKGIHSVSFDGSGLASGAYFYQLKIGNYISTKKMLLMK